MQTDPTATNARDSLTLGHRCRNHSAPMTQQHTVTAIARVRFSVPCGPIGLHISIIEMTLNPRIASATTRQVAF